MTHVIRLPYTGGCTREQFLNLCQSLHGCVMEIDGIRYKCTGSAWKAGDMEVYYE